MNCDESKRQVSVVGGGVARFQRLAERLPVLLEELRHAPAWRGAQHAPLCGAPGIYLLTEDDRPVYVGQTRNIRNRLRQHRGAESRENQASLAFIIAKGDAANSHPSIDQRRTRSALARDEAFAQVFRMARERVAAMEVRFVEVDDPELRTVFEVYAAVSFGTSEYNKFETH